MAERRARTCRTRRPSSTAARAGRRRSSSGGAPPRPAASRLAKSPRVSRLRLPDLTPLAPRPERPPPTPVQAVAILLSRRQFLQALGAAAVVVATPWTRVSAGLGGDARAVLHGARAAHARGARRVDPAGRRRSRARRGSGSCATSRACSRRSTIACRASTPAGPFSGRQPFIDYETRRAGAPPAEERLQALRPADAAPGALLALADPTARPGCRPTEQALVAPLDAQLGGPLSGLRDVYRDGLAGSTR